MHTRTRRTYRLLVGFLLILIGLAVGTALTLKLTVTQWDFVGGGIYSAEPPLPLPTLQILTAGAPSDGAALAAIVDYFNQHETTIRALFHEPQPERLRGLYAMYITHISFTYNSPPTYATLLDYIGQPDSDCSAYAHNQRRISEALGLEAREITISGGTHVWTEVNVGGRWEVFDGTVNVWLNRSGYELERGAVREYRAFYTPLLDVQTPVNANTLSGQRLRIQMIGLGVYWTPLAYLTEWHS
jgi:hypothetical protein